jgi:hypothetical protein
LVDGGLISFSIACWMVNVPGRRRGGRESWKRATNLALLLTLSVAVRSILHLTNSAHLSKFSKAQRRLLDLSREAVAGAPFYLWRALA